MTLTLFGQGLGESPEARQTVGAQLVQDARQHLGQLLGLGVAGDGEGIGSEGGLHFGVVEVDDCPLVCEHVDLQCTEEDEDYGPMRIQREGFSWTGGTSAAAPTSSIPEMLFTPSFFRVNWSFLSSAVAVLCTTFFFLRALPWGKVQKKMHLGISNW